MNMSTINCWKDINKEKRGREWPIKKHGMQLNLIATKYNTFFMSVFESHKRDSTNLIGGI